ncbi:MAG: hypothetical protein HY662_02520 [Chloroflexi bacterium]|nr:hypothetical protein [Chloroflexota bacterium]
MLEYLHQDHLSTTSVSTYSSGIVKSTKSYLPYGATRSESGVLGTAKMFTSQRLDNSTDLYFYNARYL